MFSQLKDVAVDAAMEVLSPVAKEGASKAAQFAVDKGPDLLEGKLLPKVAAAGGPMGLVKGLTGEGGPASGLLSKLTGGGDDDENGGRGNADGTGKGRRMPIQQAVDVAAPIDVVYDEFTRFEDWPKFMHRLESVQQKEDETVVFNEKIWIIRRSWEAEIVEQRPDERIIWESVSGMKHTGIVSFHDLAERLTRIEVNVDIDPSGPMEKIARGARFAKRAVRADLHRFKAYVEMMDEEDVDGWRGEIEDGEVVADDGEYDERREDEPDAEYDDEQPEAEYEDEDEAGEEPEEEPEEDEEPEPVAESEDEEEEEEPEEEEEEEEQPAPRTRKRAAAKTSSNGSSKSAGGQRSRGASRSRSSSGSSRSRGSGNGSSKSKAASSKSSSSRAKGSSTAKSSSRAKSSSGGRSRNGGGASKSRSSSGRSSRSKAASKG